MRTSGWLQWARNKVENARKRFSVRLRNLRTQGPFHRGLEVPIITPLDHEDDTWAITTVKGGLGCVTVINQSHTGAMVSLRTEFATHSALTQKYWLEGMGSGSRQGNDNNIKFSLNGDGVRYILCVEGLEHDHHSPQTFKLVTQGEIVLIQDPDFNPPYYHFPDDENNDATTLCEN